MTNPNTCGAWQRLLAVCALITASCATSDDLSTAAVTSIPAGNAAGSTHSGTYSFVRTTRSCAGACLVAVGPLTVRFCRVGDEQRRTASLAQANGALGFTVSGESPGSYRGGIDLDGSFDVGGADTSDYGVTTVRVEGTISMQSIVASARARTRGAYMNQTVDCLATYDVLSTP